MRGQDFFTKFNQDYVSLSSGYIPNFAAGRGTLSSTADPLSLKAAQAENPFINSLDTGKLGFDRHEKLNIRLTNKKGGDKKGGGNINREFGNNAEKKAAPIVKKMGYFPAHKAGMFNAEHSAVDFIKTSNGLPKGGALTGVMELKAGGIKPETISKPLRAITENLHLPIVQNMFKKEGPENLKYDSILATRKIGPDPYKMTGMMRKGMGKGANMARGYVPNFAKGEIFGVSAMTSGKKMGKGKAGRAQAQFEKIAQSMSQAGLYGDAILNVLRNTAKSLNLTGETIKKLEPKFKSLSNNASKGNMASYVLGNNLQQTAKESKKQKTLMQRMGKQLQRPGVSMGLMFGAPMLAGLAEQTITGGKSRLDQTRGQRFAGSAVSNVTSFAASGAMIGGLPGALVGGLIGLGKAAMDTSLSLEELKQKAEEYDQTTQQVTSAAEQYIQAQKDIASGGTTKELRDAQKRAADSMEILRKSGDGLDQKFKEAEGSIDKMSEAADEFTSQRDVTSNLKDLGFQIRDLKSILPKTTTTGYVPGVGIQGSTITTPVSKKTKKESLQGLSDIMGFENVFSEFGSKIGAMGQEATLAVAQEKGPAYLAKAIGSINKYTEEQTQELEIVFRSLQGKGLFGTLIKMVPEIIKTQQEDRCSSRRYKTIKFKFYQN